jgi:uncharacterized protein
VQLEHSFSVPVGIDEAWKILLDIKRIGPCMPGAAIDAVEGDDFSGTVKVKLGPINLTYKGTASFVEKDEAAHRAVIDARGRDTRGNGTAAARVTAALSETGSGTKVRVNTDLDITGKPAQFGRGVMVDVGNKLLGQFADSLAKTIQGDDSAETGTAAGAKKARPRPPRPATPAETPAVASAVAPAAESAAVEQAVAGESETEQSTPSYSVPGGIEPMSPNGGGAAAGQASADVDEPQQEVEPINLLEHAGPAVAKRLAPVALALVVVMIAARRRRKRRG